MQLRLLAIFSLTFIGFGGIADCSAQQAKEVVVTETPMGPRLGVPSAGMRDTGKPTAQSIYPNSPDRKWNLNYPDANSSTQKPVYGGTNRQLNVRETKERPAEMPDDASAKLRAKFGTPNGRSFDQLAAPRTLSVTQPTPELSADKPLYQVPGVQFHQNTDFSAPTHGSTMLPAEKPSFDFPLNLAIPSQKPILERLLLQGRVVKSDKNDQNHLSFGIIGIQWTKLNYPTVVRVFPGTPAERAGIRPRDQIIAIDSKSLLGQSIDDVTTTMIGVPNTTMIVSLERDGQLSAAVIVRMDVDEVKDPSVRAAYGRSLRRLSDPKDPADLRF